MGMEARRHRHRRYLPLQVLLLGFALLAGSGLAGAAVYRWVDGDGAVHFSDRPPAGAQFQELDTPAPSPSKGISDAERRARQQKLLDMYEEERAGKREAREKREAQKQERQTRCNYAADRLRRYQAAPILYEPLAGGERRVLSDAERERAIREVREAVQAWCR